MQKSPYLTVSNLVEYASVKSAARRRSIIEQYHEPKIFKLNWHGASDAIFTGRICKKENIDEFIDSEKARLRGQISGHARRDQIPKHILEIVELLETSDLQKIADDAHAESAAPLAPDMQIGNLTVGVRPNLILRRSKPGKRYPEVGVVKCHNLSSNRLDEHSAKLFATALQMYAEEILRNGEINPELCKVYDLHADSLNVAPRHQMRLRRQLADSAEEICDRWGAVGTRLQAKREQTKKAS